MKYMKKIWIVSILIASILLSIKSSYAENATVVEITPTTTHTLDISVDSLEEKISWELESDLRVYQDLKIKDITLDEGDTKTVILTLENTLKDENKYSLLSVAWAEGDMEFSYSSSIANGEFMNNSFEGLWQGIVKAVVQQNVIKISFYKEIEDLDVDFKFYQNVWIDTVKTSGADILEVLLTDTLINESIYVATTTFFSDSSNEKIEIENGIYDFSTIILDEYDPEAEEKEIEESKEKNNEEWETKDIDLNKETKTEVEWKEVDTTSAVDEKKEESDTEDLDELTLQSALVDVLDESWITQEWEEMLEGMTDKIKVKEIAEEWAELLHSALENIDWEEALKKGTDMLETALWEIKGADMLKEWADMLEEALENSKEELLESELELMAELNAAADDDNNKPTQLENVAMSTKETPDTWAATWVLLLGTFIINTFLYCSRRKKSVIA